jgi:hypothetical protein
MEIVRKVLIYVLPRIRRNEGSDDEIDVGDEEEEGDGECSADGWIPLLWVAVHGEGVKVEVD